MVKVQPLPAVKLPFIFILLIYVLVLPITFYVILLRGVSSLAKPVSQIQFVTTLILSFSSLLLRVFVALGRNFRGGLRQELDGIKFLYFHAHRAEGRRRFQRGEQSFRAAGIEAVLLEPGGKRMPRLKGAGLLERGAVGTGRIDGAGGKRKAERAEQEAEDFLHGGLQEWGLGSWY